MVEVTLGHFADWLRSTCRGGIAREDAEQLLLWLFCTSGLLPAALREAPPERAELCAAFAALEELGLVRDAARFEPPVSTDARMRSWDLLIDDLLRARITLDPLLPDRLRLLGAG